MKRRGYIAPTSSSGDRDGTERWLAIFVRGITAGALVGAAIAGSTIWRRRSPTTDVPDAKHPGT
ncbi:MAG: hypothetical protein ACYDCI_12280 [Candidatus Limnocylindrales bacterium]